MKSRQLLVWCVILLLVSVPAVRLADTARDGLPHHASMKSARSSPSGWRTVTIAPGFLAALPVFVHSPAAPLPPLDRLTVAEPAVPFHPPRG